MNAAPLSEGWGRVQTRLVARLRTLEPEQLGLWAGDPAWPVWALVSHLAGARVYWLCQVLGEPGRETTAFPDPEAPCWEDQPELPRGCDDLLWAVESSWRIVEAALDRWTAEMLAEEFTRVGAGGGVQVHTRASVLTRLVMHDSFHCGEVSLTLGMHGHPSLDPWEPV